MQYASVTIIAVVLNIAPITALKRVSTIIKYMGQRSCFTRWGLYIVGSLHSIVIVAATMGWSVNCSKSDNSLISVWFMLGTGREPCGSRQLTTCDSRMHHLDLLPIADVPTIQWVWLGLLVVLKSTAMVEVHQQQLPAASFQFLALSLQIYPRFCRLVRMRIPKSVTLDT